MVAEFGEYFVEEQDPLKTLYLDFGYGRLETQMPTLAEPLTGMDQNMTRLYIGHLIEGFDVYLYQLLKWTAALAELKLVNCAMMRIRIGRQDPDDMDTDNIDQLEYGWRNVFELCAEDLEFLNEQFIDNLHYLPRPESETRQVGVRIGLTCGLALYTTNTRDMRALDHSRRQVQHPRIEADMGSSKWLDRF